MTQIQSQKLQSKLEKLEERLAEIKEQLIREHKDSWGEEQAMQKQQLLQEQAFVEDQLAKLQTKVETDADHSQTFKLEVEGMQKEVTLVEPEFVSPRDGMISHSSPLAQALASVAEGDAFEIQTPFGAKNYVLLAKY